MLIHTVKVYPSKIHLPKKKQLAWKIAEIASDNSKLNKDQLEIFKNLAKKISKLIVIIKQRNTKIELENFKKDLSKININKIDYFEIRDEENLEVSDDCSVSRLFIALYIDKIRIIDNFKLY